MLVFSRPTVRSQRERTHLPAVQRGLPVDLYLTHRRCWSRLQSTVADLECVSCLSTGHLIRSVFMLGPGIAYAC